jgi:hypothetical protein
MKTTTNIIAAVALTALALAGLATAAPPVRQLPSASHFVSRIDNPYLPFAPGTTFRYRGTKDGEKATDVMVVTRGTKTILGIAATVVSDRAFVGGKPEERTLDWYAQDDVGNVWYFGEDTFDFVNGKWVRGDGSWQAGVDGAKAGIVMEAHPKVGDAYRQEYYAGHAEDMARVLHTGKVLTTAEWTPLEPGVLEHKDYARGVGEVRSVMVKGGSERSQLGSVKHAR